jgi:hypothetical protein
MATSDEERKPGRFDSLRERLLDTQQGRTAKSGADRAKDAGKAMTDLAGRGFDKGVATVTLRDARQSLEGAMAQIVEVLCAHEAEILALRKRVEELDRTRRIEPGVV